MLTEKKYLCAYSAETCVEFIAGICDNIHPCPDNDCTETACRFAHALPPRCVYSVCYSNKCRALHRHPNLYIPTTRNYCLYGAACVKESCTDFHYPLQYCHRTFCQVSECPHIHTSTTLYVPQYCERGVYCVYRHCAKRHPPRPLCPVALCQDRYCQKLHTKIHQPALDTSKLYTTRMYSQPTLSDPNDVYCEAREHNTAYLHLLHPTTEISESDYTFV